MTGGEDGLGGIKRPLFAGIDFETALPFYTLVATIGFGVVYRLWRFHRSPVGTVLVAIRENEQRARFLGYATTRYKLVAFTLSAVLTGLAGTLLLFNNRMTSAEPISVAFSGELLAMVVIGGMSFLGPALGALFFVVFRDYLSSVTENWLFWFGLLFVAFIVFLAGRARRRRPAPAEAVPQDARRGRCHVGAQGRRGRAPGLHEAGRCRRRHDPRPRKASPGASAASRRSRMSTSPCATASCMR